jgi:hypothetical protein
MKTNITSSIHSARHSFGRVVCAGAVLLIASSVQAQNMFVSHGANIYEFTPNGTQSTFASGLLDPVGLAFDRAGDLFESDWGSGHIYQFTPNGTQSTFASGLNYPWGLAFNNAGNLFEADSGSGQVYEYTPNGVQSIFATGLGAPNSLAFQGVTLPVPEPSALGMLAIVGAIAFLTRWRVAGA